MIENKEKKTQMISKVWTWRTKKTEVENLKKNKIER